MPVTSTGSVTASVSSVTAGVTDVVTMIASALRRIRPATSHVFNRRLVRILFQPHWRPSSAALAITRPSGWERSQVSASLSSNGRSGAVSVMMSCCFHIWPACSRSAIRPPASKKDLEVPERTSYLPGARYLFLVPHRADRRREGLSTAVSNLGTAWSPLRETTAHFARPGRVHNAVKVACTEPRLNGQIARPNTQQCFPLIGSITASRCDAMAIGQPNRIKSRQHTARRTTWHIELRRYSADLRLGRGSAVRLAGVTLVPQLAGLVLMLAATLWQSRGRDAK
jgi:hypothetical protein